MKKFKLLIATMLVAVMAFAFVACGGSPVVGTWKTAQTEDSLFTWELEVDKDESFKMTMTMALGDASQSQEFFGTWTFEDDVLTLEVIGDEDFVLE